ncbi:hypothetical protein [Pseudomonas sp. DC3000-4b1]|uniref:hypothetical protein n=1 Tax=unclassified Pseudomonas TaxID=196821 RepID=UPI003CE92266
MHVDLNSWTLTSACGAPDKTAYRTCRVTSDSGIVQAIREWEAKVAAFENAKQRLGHLLRGTPVSFTWLQGRFIGGIQLVGGVELDRHWRRADRYGARTLRLRARIPTNLRLLTPSTIQDKHERLLGIWHQHCPARIDADPTWQALGIGPGSISLWGGDFFVQGERAYVRLGFEPQLDQPGLEWLADADPVAPEEFADLHNQRSVAA